MIYILTLFFIALLNANLSKAETQESSIVHSSDSSIKKLLNSLPNGDTKRGLQEYIAILGPEKYNGDYVGVSNVGMANFFSRNFSDKTNSCVRDSAQFFYKDVANRLRQHSKNDLECKPLPSVITSEKGITKISPDYGCGRERAGILNIAGKDQFSDLEPSWLWNLALKHTKGDPNSAMFLVGMCGHDDLLHGHYIYEDKSQLAQDELRQECLEIKAKKIKIDEEIKKLSANYDLNEQKIFQLSFQAQALGAQISAAESKKTIQRGMACPPSNSGFYAPQSLGIGADIDSKMKIDIRNIQGADGAKKIPSKYYHVYGSAFMACQLIQNGFSPGQTALIQKQAARVYRGIRMCETIQTQASKQETFKKISQELMSKYKIKDASLLAVFLTKEIKSEKLNCEEAFPKECDFLNDLNLPPQIVKSSEFSLAEEQIRSKVDHFKAAGDAAELYKKWYLGGGSLGGQNSLHRHQGPWPFRFDESARFIFWQSCKAWWVV
jgi:hypothetical protein